LGATPTTIDFSQFDTGAYTFTYGPTQVGGLVGDDVVFTAIGERPGFGGGPYALGSNGSWTDPSGIDGRNGFAFINAFGTSMTFSFASAPVSAVGGFINYCPDCFAVGGPVLIEALGAGGVVLESYDLLIAAPIATGGAVNDGAFRGIARQANDIVAFRVSNRVAVIDDLSFVRAASVPEPTSVALVLLSLGGLAYARRGSLPSRLHVA
jgi:hypothetical protein